MTDTVNEYAQALFSLTKSAEELEEISVSLGVIKEVFDQTEGLAEFLASPAVSVKERVSALENALADNVCQYALSFVCILTENARIREIYEYIEAFDSLYKESKKMTEAVVVSAFELSEERKDKLRKKLSQETGKTVMLTCHVDKSLLGGLTVEVDGKRYDASVKQSLAKMKEVMDR